MPETVHTTLCDQARAGIEALAADGIVCTPDDVVLLNRLAWQIETRARRLALSRGTPVHVAGVALWPLTLAADAWWTEASKHTRRESRQRALLAYAMAHARRQDVLDAVPPADAPGVAWRWARRLPCRLQELHVAAQIVLEQDCDDEISVEDPKSQSVGLTAAEMVAVLVAAAGGTPEMWERMVSIGYLRYQLKACHAQEAADNGGSLRDSDIIHGTRQFGLACEQIRRQHANGA